MYILGINSAYHESAACILQDGILIAAAEEERFNRIKHAKKSRVDSPCELPINAINFCIREAKIKLRDVDYFGFSFTPQKRLNNIQIKEEVIKGDWGSKSGEELFYKKIKTIPQKLSQLSGKNIKNKFHWIDHHLCHAASAFFVSPFREAAIFSVDGIGEFTTTWMGYGKENKIKVLKEIEYPNSLGFVWEKMSKFLGFTEYDSAKVMGLSAYGNWKKYYQKFQEVVKIEDDGGFKINNDILKFRSNNFRTIEEFFRVKKINHPENRAGEHEDVAAGLQKITDDVVLNFVKYLTRKTNSKNLCMAGGVALNCVTNSKILLSKYFKDIYIQPAAYDAGTALGGAYYIWNNILDRPKKFVMENAFWGPSYKDPEIERELRKNNLKYEKLANIEKITAELIAKGNIAGWFQGRLEWGPRALGNRSLLVDPRNKKMKEILNKRIKKREPFRPFASSVIEEDAPKWFEIPKECKSISSEFMLFAFDTKKEKQKLIPAVIHVDGTSRIQIVTKKANPKFHKLISEFKKITDVPMVLNTSFNENEPIICSPQDAINTFKRTKIDYLVINNYLIED